MSPQPVALNFMFDKTKMINESSTRQIHLYIRFLQTALKVLTPAATHMTLDSSASSIVASFWATLVSSMLVQVCCRVLLLQLVFYYSRRSKASSCCGRVVDTFISEAIFRMCSLLFLSDGELKPFNLLSSKPHDSFMIKVVIVPLRTCTCSSASAWWIWTLTPTPQPHQQLLCYEVVVCVSKESCVLKESVDDGFSSPSERGEEIQHVCGNWYRYFQVSNPPAAVLSCLKHRHCPFKVVFAHRRRLSERTF